MPGRDIPPTPTNMFRARKLHDQITDAHVVISFSHSLQQLYCLCISAELDSYWGSEHTTKNVFHSQPLVFWCESTKSSLFHICNECFTVLKYYVTQVSTAFNSKLLHQMKICSRITKTQSCPEEPSNWRHMVTWFNTVRLKHQYIFQIWNLMTVQLIEKGLDYIVFWDCIVTSNVCSLVSSLVYLEVLWCRTHSDLTIKVISYYILHVAPRTPRYLDECLYITN